MNIKAKELVDLIVDKDVIGIKEFVEILRDKIKSSLFQDGKDVYELSVTLNLNYKKLSSYIHGDDSAYITFEDLFKLVEYLNK